jgi:hypothetical protein
VQRTFIVVFDNHFLHSFLQPAPPLFLFLHLVVPQLQRIPLAEDAEPEFAAETEESAEFGVLLELLLLPLGRPSCS